MIHTRDEFEEVVTNAIMSWNWLHHNDDDFVEFGYVVRDCYIEIIADCETVDIIAFSECYTNYCDEYYADHYGKKKEGSMHISERKVRDALGFKSCDIHDLRGWKIDNIQIQPVIIGKFDIRTLIKKVIFNDPATIILWTDGSKTVVKVGPNETYDPEKGMAMCICKKVLGNKGNFNDVFKKYMED